MADYAAEIVPHLAERATLRLVRPPEWEAQSDPGWAQGMEWVEHDEKPAKGWIPLLHLGNNPYHLWVVRRLRRFGGIVVLHDTVLHHLVVEEAAADDNWERFAAELESAHGRRGAALAEARRWGFTGRLDPFLLPARQVYLQHASGVVVHSATAAREVRGACPDVPVRCVPLAVATLPPGNRNAWRKRLGVGETEILLVHLGFVTPVKGFEVILQALAALDELGVPFRFVVVGDGVEGSPFVRLAADSRIRERVLPWGFATVEDLGGILGAADLGLVPRYPTAGETSAAALRFLAAATPVVVSGYGQFLELPHGAAFRITPGRQGVADLVRWVARLAADRDALADASMAARRAWVEGGHDPERAATALLVALEEIHGGVV